MTEKYKPGFSPKGPAKRLGYRRKTSAYYTTRSVDAKGRRTALKETEHMDPETRKKRYTLSGASVREADAYDEKQ